MAAWEVHGAALRLRVRLTPKGGRDAIEGVEALSDGRLVLKARVRAVPEDGAANAALLKLIAASCGIAPSHVTLVSGATQRIKTLELRGDPEALARRLAPFEVT